jgi:phosphatidylserine decarboxylase
MIAREGLPFIVIGVVITTVLVGAALKWDSGWLFSAGALLTLLTLFTIFFFRDPPRYVIVEPDLLLAPADGRILSIDTVENHPYVGSQAIKISIFLSMLDVHINRIPATGRIDYIHYNPGKFFPAFTDKASEQNEQTEIGMTTAGGYKIVVKQIAGIIARRIVCRPREGDFVSAGDRFGMIRFGSRTELFVPADSDLRVEAGDHVKGGLTIIGHLPTRTPRTVLAEAAKGENAEL